MIWRGFFLVVLLIAFAASIQAQEAVRISLASEQAATFQKTSPGDYNIEMGPVYLRMLGQMGLELNDNANYASSNPDRDVGLLPNLQVGLFYPITERNALVISTGLGYVEYLRDPVLSHLAVSSGSGLDFKMYSGDFIFDFHDIFSAIDYQTQDPAVSASFIRLENTPGVSATWDLYKMILSIGYDYDMYISLTPAFDYTDNRGNIFTGRMAFLYNSLNQAGLEAGGGTTTYEENVLDNSTHYSIGPFYQAKWSPHFKGTMRVGLTAYDFAHNGTVLNTGNFVGPYADVTLTHQLNQAFSQTLSGGRGVQLGINTDISKTDYVHYQANWNFIRNVFTTFGFEYDIGSEPGFESYTELGPSAGLRWQMTGKISWNVQYTFLDKLSNPSLYDFTQNRLVIRCDYSF